MSQLTSTPTRVGLPSMQQPGCDMENLPNVPQVTDLLEKAFPNLHRRVEKPKSTVTQPEAVATESKKQPTTLPHETLEEPRGNRVYYIGHQADNKDDSKKGRQDHPRQGSGAIVLASAFTLPFHLGRIDFVNEPVTSVRTVATVLAAALIAAVILMCLVVASVDIVSLTAVVIVQIGLFVLWAAPALGPITVLATLASYLRSRWG